MGWPRLQPRRANQLKRPGQPFLWGLHHWGTKVTSGNVDLVYKKRRNASDEREDSSYVTSLSLDSPNYMKVKVAGDKMADRIINHLIRLRE